MWRTLLLHVQVRMCFIVMLVRVTDMAWVLSPVLLCRLMHKRRLMQQQLS